MANTSTVRASSSASRLRLRFVLGLPRLPLRFVERVPVHGRRNVVGGIERQQRHVARAADAVGVGRPDRVCRPRRGLSHRRRAAARRSPAPARGASLVVAAQVAGQQDRAVEHGDPLEVVGHRLGAQRHRQLDFERVAVFPLAVDARVTRPACSRPRAVSPLSVTASGPGDPAADGEGGA